VKVFILCAFLALLPCAGAFTREPPAAESSWPQEDLEKVLASPDFGGVDESWGIRFRKTEEKEDEKEEKLSLDLSSFWERFGKVREFFGKALRSLLAILILGAAGFTIFLLLKTRGKGFPASQKPRSAGVRPPGPRDEPLGLLENARAFYARGDIREAWAFCLRAARAAYSASRGLVFPPGATEYNCLSLVREAGGDSSGGFGRLVNGWIQTAYAGHLPSGEAFEEALEFCRALAAREEGPGA
jgi:hypothetical protein